MSEMCDRNIEGNENFPHLHAMSTAAEMPMVLSRNVHTKMAIRGAMIDTYPLPKGTFLKMIFLFPRWEICFPGTITPSFLSSGWIMIIIALHGIFRLFSNGPKTHQKCLFSGLKIFSAVAMWTFYWQQGYSAFFPEQHPPIQWANCHEAHRKKSQNLKEKTMKALYVPWAH